VEICDSPTTPFRSLTTVLLDRSYFDLQSAFARRVADLEQLPLGEACRLHTAFYALARDNDAGVEPERNDFDPTHPAWVEFEQAIAIGADPAEYAHGAYLEGDVEEESPQGPCFTFNYWPEDRLVRIHFGNDSQGLALRPESVEARTQELQSILVTIASDHSEAAVVRGTSWLYHLDAYRRLFPPRFIERLSSAGHPHQFAALWCQFIDRHGVVKPDLAIPFLDAIERSSTTYELDGAFPLDVLAATAEIGLFYDQFGTR
jgi:hypothetical protein